MEDTDNKSVPGKRQAVADRLKKKYPEDNYEDDEALWGRVDSEYTDYENRLNGYEEREKGLVDLFDKDPRSAAFIGSMARGEDPFMMMVRELGAEGLTDLMEDPARQDALAEANKEYLERVAREKGLEEEYRANLRASLDGMDALQQERGLSDEQIDAAADLLLQTANDVIMGKFSREHMEMALKALDYDAAVASAQEEGEVRGRNTRIEEQLRKPKEGDGLPAIGGQNGGQAVQPRRRSSFFDALEEL